jgi:GT2 family glycosyltransferase
MPPNPLEPITVIIPFHSNETGLAVTLATLQAQLVPPKAIIVIDTSKDKSGLPIAQRYTTNNVPIVVEVAQVGIYEAWNKGIELAGDSDVLIINDDLLLPMNFIDVLMVCRQAVPGLAYVPLTPRKDHYQSGVDVDFPWYCPDPRTLTIDDFAQTDWLPGFCFLLTKEAVKEVGQFDTRFQVWYGDDDYQKRLIAKGREMDINPIVLVKSLYAYHYGGTSYKYLDKAVVRKIGKDRRKFTAKYKQNG